MSSELRRAFRIALSFTAAFVLAESLHWDIQLTFIAPVIAGMLASGPAARVGTLLVLPILVWLLVTAAESAVGLMAGKPMLLGLFSLAVFHLAFRLHQDPSRATIGFLLLIVFAILPLNLIRAQELGSDLTRWFALNFAVAAGCELITRTLLPDPGRPAAVARLPQLPPLASALALQVAVILTATIQPPAPGAVMIGVILVLRADGESAAHVVRDRFVAAFLGGAAAVAVWKVLWLAPSLPTLAGATFVGVFPFARRVARGGPGIGIAMKSINVLAILMGEGFSVLFDDADDRISTRIAGVIIGLVYATLVLLATRRITARWREHRNGPAPAACFAGAPSPRSPPFAPPAPPLGRRPPLPSPAAGHCGNMIDSSSEGRRRSGRLLTQPVAGISLRRPSNGSVDSRTDSSRRPTQKRAAASHEGQTS